MVNNEDGNTEEDAKEYIQADQPPGNKQDEPIVTGTEDTEAVAEFTTDTKPEDETTAEPFHPVTLEDEGNEGGSRHSAMLHVTGYGDGIVYRSATTDENNGPANSNNYCAHLWANVNNRARDQTGRGTATTF